MVGGRFGDRNSCAGSRIGGRDVHCGRPSGGKCDRPKGGHTTSELGSELGMALLRRVKRIETLPERFWQDERSKL